MAEAAMPMAIIGPGRMPVSVGDAPRSDAMMAVSVMFAGMLHLRMPLGVALAAAAFLHQHDAVAGGGGVAQRAGGRCERMGGETHGRADRDAERQNEAR